MTCTSVMGSARSVCTQGRVVGNVAAASSKPSGSMRRDRSSSSWVATAKVTENVRLSPWKTAYLR